MPFKLGTWNTLVAVYLEAYGFRSSADATDIRWARLREPGQEPHADDTRVNWLRPRAREDLGLQTGWKEGEVNSLCFAERIPEDEFHLIPDRVSFRGATRSEQKDRGLRETPFDFVGFADRTYIVSQRFVDCVESVEPGVHQWIPMKVYNKGAPAYVGHPLYLMNIMHMPMFHEHLHPDTIAEFGETKIDDREELPRPVRSTRMVRGNVVKDWVYSADYFSSHHICITGSHYVPDQENADMRHSYRFIRAVFVSDELGRAMKDAKLTNVSYQQTQVA